MTEEKQHEHKEEKKEHHHTEKHEEKKEENKVQEKKIEKKKTEEKPKKAEAIVNGRNLGISKKQSMAICKFIKRKSPEKAIQDLERVIKMKMAVPMKGEIPHRKGNIMSGRYPINASKVFIKLLKELNANSSVNGIENPIVFLAKADRASRPSKRFGSERFKRANIYLVAREKKMHKEKKQ